MKTSRFVRTLPATMVAAFVCILVAAPVSATRPGTGTPEKYRALFDSIVHDREPIVFKGGLYTSLEFLRTGASTCGRYLLARVTVPPGGGPPPHIHHWTDEWFYLPDGGAVMYMGNREYRDIDAPPDRIGKDTLTLIPIEKGELFFGAKHQIHGYVNATDKPIVVYIVWTPDPPGASILEYFRGIAKPIFADDSLNAPSFAVQALRAAGTARQYGMNFSTDFWDYAKEIKEGHHNHGPNKFDELERLIKEGDMPCRGRR